MKASMSSLYPVIMAVLLIIASFEGAAEARTALGKVKPQRVTCPNRRSRCFLKYVTCPIQCPSVKPKDPNAKACYLDCYSPKCEAVCRRRKPNCNGAGAACYDPRFIGGDNIVFYFHGKSGQHFALVSDSNLQINARFIGLRPAGRTRDCTWIQALGLMFGSHNFTLEATRAETWDGNVDHLNFSYNGEALELPEGHDMEWVSPQDTVRLDRTSNSNSVSILVDEVVEISVNVVPITKHENQVHNYQIPGNDSFAHLEVQFRFLALSSKVEGVLGRTYRPDFENPAKPGVQMAIVGGEDRYKTSPLLSADCTSCIFHTDSSIEEGSSTIIHSLDGTVNCARGMDGGYGMVCKK